MFLKILCKFIVELCNKSTETKARVFYIILFYIIIKMCLFEIKLKRTWVISYFFCNNHVKYF